MAAAPWSQHAVRELPESPDTDSDPVRVLVVDDNAGFRESLISLLTTDELLVVGEAQTGIEAIELAQRIRPDVVLMDVRMPSMDGVEATRRMKELLPDVGVVALTGNEDQKIVREMLVAGASGYVLKDSDGEDIFQAVLQAAHGGGVISPGVTPTVIEELTEALERERQRARELERAHEALVERSVRRHEQLARLSHELRTPVTVILGMAQILAGGRAGDQEKEILERMVSRTEGLAHLLERFELAVDAAFTERVDVAEVAGEVADREGGRVRVVAAPNVPRASLNPIVARRLLEELVDNALRFSADEAPVEIRISHGRDGAEVRVVDHGPGVDPELRDRIFAPLEQGEDVNVRTHQGVGLGLSLARTAARAGDGDVSLEESGPEGSVFLWRVGPGS